MIIYSLYFYRISGEETRWASRSGYLDAPTLQKFNNAPIIVDKYESNIQTLLFPCLHAMALEEKNQHITHIRVYGELFGGKYEGHKVKLSDIHLHTSRVFSCHILTPLLLDWTVFFLFSILPLLLPLFVLLILSLQASHRAIQKEVAYCPGIEFIVFDIECVLALSPENSSNGHSEGKSEPDTDRDTDKDIDSDTHEGVPAMSNSSFFLTHEEVMRVCRDCQLPVLDVMHTGTLADMLALVPVRELLTYSLCLPVSVCLSICLCLCLSVIEADNLLHHCLYTTSQPPIPYPDMYLLFGTGTTYWPSYFHTT